jgi:hypothetical protein
LGGGVGWEAIGNWKKEALFTTKKVADPRDHAAPFLCVKGDLHDSV